MTLDWSYCNLQCCLNALRALGDLVGRGFTYVDCLWVVAVGRDLGVDEVFFLTASGLLFEGWT